MAAPWVYARVMRPLMGMPQSEGAARTIAKCQAQAPSVLGQLEAWLQGGAASQREDAGGVAPSGQPGFVTFLAGTAQPSIADLSAAVELTSCELMPGWAEEHLPQYPGVEAWMGHLKTLPGYDQSHKVMAPIAAKAAALGV